MPSGAIIGGSGIYTLPGLSLLPRTVETAYGPVELFVSAGEELVFLPRHGPRHTVPPHRINYRANLKALQTLGVERVLSLCTVGSLHSGLPPASAVLLSDFIDFTRGRVGTFYDGDDGVVAHVDVTQPYCPALRARVLKHAAARGLALVPEGVYACMEGPRLETAAEIRMLARLGGDVVGMTGVPEVTLARELGLCFASIAVSVNWGAGLISETINFEEARAACDRVKAELLALSVALLRDAEPYPACGCASALHVVQAH
jgi:5'-methylthioadenosine phosphorylase